MPAQRIAGGRLTVSQFDVLGLDSPEIPTFIGHVGLAAKPLTASNRTELRLAHMVPPFERSSRLPDSDDLSCHGVIPLQDFEARAIASFVTKIHSEYAAERKRRQQQRRWDDSAKEHYHRDQYVVHPHVRWPSQHRRYHQFSCAGFVQEAYAAAGILLVDTDEVSIPSCSMQCLGAAYPSDYLADQTFRTEKGLAGNGPWPVLLPGYIINALSRSRADIDLAPYQAAVGDEYFPPQRGSATSVTDAGGEPTPPPSNALTRFTKAVREKVAAFYWRLNPGKRRKPDHR